VDACQYSERGCYFGRMNRRLRLYELSTGKSGVPK
jgi:hypothetical protein